MSSSEVKQLSPFDSFRAQIAAYEKKALPELLNSYGINPAQFIQKVINAVRSDNKMLQCYIENPASLFASILLGAEFGFAPTDQTGEFYIVPRSIKQPDGTYKMTACPVIGYKGIVSLLYRSGDVVQIVTEVVYEGDQFDVELGIDPKITHKPNYLANRTAEKITFAYAVAKNKYGERQFYVMTRDEILAIKNKAKYENNLYFNDKDSPNRWMEKKAALIQLSKLLPKDYYGKKATGITQIMEGGAYVVVDENNQIKVLDAEVKQTGKPRLGFEAPPLSALPGQVIQTIAPVVSDTSQSSLMPEKMPIEQRDEISEPKSGIILEPSQHSSIDESPQLINPPKKAHRKKEPRKR